MTIPRNPAEIWSGDGKDGLGGKSTIKDISGKDVTFPFISGAGTSERIILENKIDFAVLNDCSLSC